MRTLVLAFAISALVNTRLLAAVESLSLPDQPFDPAVWKLVGSNPESHVHPADDHIAISIGADDTSQSVGFGPVAALSGDFEIRGEYEIEVAPEPTTGFGSGPTIFLSTRSRSKNTATIGRLNRVKDGEFFSAYWGQTVDGQRVHHPQLKPGSGSRGVLVLQRAGKTLTYSTGTSWDGPFKAIRVVQFGDEDVNYVRIGVDRGGDQQPIRVLWRRVMIQSERDEPAAKPAETASRPSQPTRSPGAIHTSGNAIILGVLGAAAVATIAAWWFKRGRHLS